LQVQLGAATVQVADESFTLDVGDALTFAGDVAHAYVNPRARAAKFSLTVFQPGVGSATRAEVVNA
jgi:quercetin dioxygenase-like cupin family protein